MASANEAIDNAPYHWEDLTPLFEDEPVWSHETIYWVTLMATTYDKRNNEILYFGWKNKRTPIALYANILFMKGKIS